MPRDCDLLMGLSFLVLRLSKITTTIIIRRTITPPAAPPIAAPVDDDEGVAVSMLVAIKHVLIITDSLRCKTSSREDIHHYKYSFALISLWLHTRYCSSTIRCCQCTNQSLKVQNINYIMYRYIMLTCAIRASETSLADARYRSISIVI